MTKSRKRKKKKMQRFETASTLVLGRVRRERRGQSAQFAMRKSLWLMLAALIVMVVGALWLAFDDRFYVYRADVVGAERVSPDEVFRASGLPGLHTLWARQSQIEDRILEALPALESAHVSCGLPAECIITVVERQPEVVWEDSGRLWWIDAEGVIFPPPLSSPPQGQSPLRDCAPTGGKEGGAEGWFVRGPLPRNEDGRLDKRVRVALSELRAAGADIPSELRYAPGRGLVFADERGWIVAVGQGPGMAERLQVFDQVAGYLEASGLTPRFVDVRFPGAPYYSLTEDW